MFENVAIYESLRKRQDEKSRLYCSLIDPLYLNMNSLLENIKVNFKEFPDHGIGHTERILQNISLILSGRTIRNLSSLEITILIFSALFHDSGMSLINETADTEFIRKEHHRLAAKVINAYFDNFLMNIPEQQRIRNAVIFVCEAHNFTMEELENDDRFEIVDTISLFNVRYGILAFLLRIGDLMDIEADRVNCLRMMLFSKSFNKISFDHNKRHQNIINYRKDCRLINIVVKAENDDQYDIWYEWFAFLKQDLEKFNALYAGECFRLPTLRTTIKRDDETLYIVKRDH